MQKVVEIFRLIIGNCKNHVKRDDRKMVSLEGKRVAVLVETEYIPEEIDYYLGYFGKLGAEVDLMTYLWGKDERVIVSDVDSPDKQVKQMTITKEIADANPNDYDIVLTRVR